MLLCICWRSLASTFVDLPPPGLFQILRCLFPGRAIDTSFPPKCGKSSVVKIFNSKINVSVLGDYRATLPEPHASPARRGIDTAVEHLVYPHPTPHSLTTAQRVAKPGIYDTTYRNSRGGGRAILHNGRIGRQPPFLANLRAWFPACPTPGALPETDGSRNVLEQSSEELLVARENTPGLISLTRRNLDHPLPRPWAWFIAAPDTQHFPGEGVCVCESGKGGGVLIVSSNASPLPQHVRAADRPLVPAAGIKGKSMQQRQHGQ
ncbi:uncharacterized protein V6R79_008236 [Siganus canaliculatus]